MTHRAQDINPATQDPRKARPGRSKWRLAAAIALALLLLLLAVLFSPRGDEAPPEKERAAQRVARPVATTNAGRGGPGQVSARPASASEPGPSLAERILAQPPPDDAGLLPRPGSGTNGPVDPSTPTRAIGMELDAGQLGPVGEKGVYTSLFGVESQGNNFAYVFDRSGSMGEPDSKPLRAAKAELLRSLEALGDLQQFQIIFYNERPVLMQIAAQPGRLVLATKENKALAADHLARITAGGGTGHEEALSAALRFHPDVLYFLTDADEPPLNGEQLARLRRLNDGLTKIHTIEFGRGPKQSAPGNFIEQLAKENGGEYRYVDVEGLKEDGGS